MRIFSGHARVLLPQALLAGRHLDIGEVSGQGKNAGAEQFAALDRILAPVVAIGGLGGINVPFPRWIAGTDDVAHQGQCARDDRTTGLGGVKEFMLIDLVGLGVMANEDHVGLLVMSRQKQVQQYEEALCHVFAGLVHRSGYVHDAEHNGPADRLRYPNAIAVAQVDRVEVGNIAQAALQALDFLFECSNLVGERGRVAPGFGQAGAQLPEFAPLLAAQGDAPAERTAHRAKDVDIVGRAVAGESGATILEFGRLGQLRLYQVGEREVVEKNLHEFFARKREGEIVFSFAVPAGATAASGTAALGARNLVATGVFLVARYDVFTRAARAMAKSRLGHILPGNRDGLALVDVADAAVADGAPHGIAYLVAIALEKTLAVADRLVLARQAPVDDLLQHAHLRFGREQQIGTGAGFS